MDKVKSECRWDRDVGHWILPKLVTTKTILNLPESPKDSTVGHHRRSLNSSPVQFSSDFGMDKSCGGLSTSRSGVVILNSSQETLEEDKYLSYLQRTDDSPSEYFKPKRSREILSQARLSSKGNSPSHMNRGVLSTSTLESSVGMPNAATVHGVDAYNIGGMHPGKRLQSLVNVAPPHSFLSSQENHLDILDMNKKKKHTLEPLSDTKLRSRSK